MTGAAELKHLREAQARVRDLETKLTPGEFLAASKTASETGDRLLADLISQSHSARALALAGTASDLRLESETRFSRHYSLPGTQRRRLLVAFTGSARRMMMPLPIFMQALPPDVDLLLLFDRQNDHYRSGIWDGMCTLSSLPASTASLRHKYADVISLGTSSGGLPAVRFAKLAGLRRGLSFGGRAIDDTLRILRGTPSSEAHDPLCACDRQPGTEAIFCFAALHPEDTLSALQAAACANAHLVPLWGRREHGVLWTVFTMGRLGDLLSLAFTAPPEKITGKVGEWIAEGKWEGEGRTGGL